MLDEELEFYGWLEEQPEFAGCGRQRRLMRRIVPRCSRSPAAWLAGIRRAGSRAGRRSRSGLGFSRVSRRLGRRGRRVARDRGVAEGQRCRARRGSPKSPRDVRMRTTMKANRLVAICIALLALLAGHGTRAGRRVARLSEAQRQLLAPHEQRWAELEPQRQQQIARGAERWLEMNRRDRGHAQDRFEIWSGMSDEQRAAARQRYQEFRRLPPERARAAHRHLSPLSHDAARAAHGAAPAVPRAVAGAAADVARATAAPAASPLSARAS